MCFVVLHGFENVAEPREAVAAQHPSSFRQIHGSEGENILWRSPSSNILE